MSLLVMYLGLFFFGLLLLSLLLIGEKIFMGSWFLFLASDLFFLLFIRIREGVKMFASFFVLVYKIFGSFFGGNLYTRIILSFLRADEQG